MPGEHVYTVYEKAGNRQYCSIDLHLLQAAARPVHNQSERAVNLVMTHRLRPGRDGLVFLLRFDRDWQDIGVVGGRVADGRAGALVVATSGLRFNRPHLIRRRLSKLGSEHLLLQWMRKPSAGKSGARSASGQHTLQKTRPSGRRPPVRTRGTGGTGRSSSKRRELWNGCNILAWTRGFVLE